MKKHYLIIWQFGDNNQSRQETPIDVLIYKSYNAEQRYKSILDKLKYEIGESDNDYVRILGIYSLE